MSTNTALPTAPDASDQHDARGRFVKGNKGGPGNPLAGKVNQVRKAFLEYFEGEGMQALCHLMFSKAMSGDPRYLRIILQFIIGKLPSDFDFANDPGVAQIAAEAFASLSGAASSGAAPSGEIENGAGDDSPVAEGDTADQAAAIADAGIEQVVVPSPTDVALTARLGLSVAELSNRPHSKERERLLKLLEERDPLRGDLWAGPPSTNGLGAAHHSPLTGT